MFNMSDGVIVFRVPGSDRAKYDQALRRQNPVYASSGDFPATRDPAATRDGQGAISTELDSISLRKLRGEGMRPTILDRRYYKEYFSERDLAAVNPRGILEGIDKDGEEQLRRQYARAQVQKRPEDQNESDSPSVAGRNPGWGNSPNRVL
jgi:hypothetical protein